MGRTSEKLKLTEKQESVLRKYANKRDISIQEKARITIILMASEGKSIIKISKALVTETKTVAKWRKRWLQHQEELLIYEQKEEKEYKLLNQMLLVLKDKARPGAIPKFSMEQKKQIVALACTNPLDMDLPFTQWNRKLLAKIAIEKNIITEIFKLNIQQLEINPN